MGLDTPAPAVQLVHSGLKRQIDVLHCSIRSADRGCIHVRRYSLPWRGEQSLWARRVSAIPSAPLCAGSETFGKLLKLNREHFCVSKLSFMFSHVISPSGRWEWERFAAHVYPADRQRSLSAILECKRNRTRKDGESYAHLGTECAAWAWKARFG